MADAGKRSPLFTESPLGVLALDRQGRVLDVNDPGCRDLGRPREQILNQPFFRWILPGDRDRAKAALETVLERRKVELRVRIRRGDGLPRLHLASVSPLCRGESVEGVLVFLRSFSERRDGGPESRQLQALLENLPGQFVLVTDKNGRIRYSSGLGRTHFHDNTAALGLPLKELMGPEREGEGNLDELLEHVCRGESWGGVQWHRRKDGVSFPVEVFASSYLDERTGQVLGGLLVGRDLSASRKWREVAEEVQPLARIGSLTGRISQEIREGLARLGAALSGNPGGARGERELGSARDELEGLQRFLDGIREFGDRGNPRPHSIPLADSAHRALERASGRMAAMGIQPVLEVPPNLPSIFADEVYLNRVLDIVLENALDAVEDSPIPLLRLELKNGSDGVVLRVTNSGSGVQEDWLGEIFDPFFSTRIGRPGLGLAVARGMMEAHGGRIWAEVPQEGFLVLALEFPRESPDREFPFRPTPLNLSRTRTVLIVDDDEAVRGAVGAFLSKVGYEVKEAWSGRSALAQLTSGRLPELVLTDLKMSDGSGYWFLEEMRREFPVLVKRTIIVTGDADHEAAHELSSETGCPLVRKPFEMPDLLEILDRVMLQN